MKEINPDLLSDIKVQYYESDDYTDILIIKYVGKYKYGSAGNNDARYMYAKGKLGFNLFEPEGIILDFQELEYQWGDMIELVFDIGVNEYEDEQLPIALVIGNGCEEGIGTLIYGINSEKTNATTEEWIFDNFDDAWRYVEKRIEK